jgi:hypothetical protein
LKLGFVEVTFDSSYVTGGEPIVYTDIAGLDTELVGLVPIAQNIKTWCVFYDSTADTLVANAVGAEATSTGDLTGLTVKLLFIGW